MTDIYLVHKVIPRTDGLVDKRLTAKFAIDNGEFHHLCDYHGLLSSIGEGKLDAKGQKALSRLFNASYYKVTKKADPMSTSSTSPAQLKARATPPGPAPIGDDLEGGTAPSAPGRPASVFDYIRQGMDKPHTIEISGQRVLLDGNVLSTEEHQKVLENVRRGLAVIRYRRPQIDYRQHMTQTPAPDALNKFEGLFFDLHKAEGLADSMEALRALVQAGHMKQDHYDSIRKELYADEACPDLGNKRAFKEHQLANREGVYASCDINGLKGVNDAHGHEAGDQLIGAVGKSLRAAIDKTVGSEHAKAWHLSGDEFAFHAPSHEHAAQVLRAFHTEMASRPMVKGTHKVSASVGLGADYATADKAMYHAKAAKVAAISAIGGDPHSRTSGAPHHMYAHSLVPGHEGAVPTAHDQLPFNPPGAAQSMATQAAKIHTTPSMQSEAAAK